LLLPKLLLCTGGPKVESNFYSAGKQQIDMYLLTYLGGVGKFNNRILNRHLKYKKTKDAFEDAWNNILSKITENMKIR
jgi:hypothetical protein